MTNETKTHWEGCWEADTHGECARLHARAAVKHIHKLQAELAAALAAKERAEAERDALAAKLAEAERDLDAMSTVWNAIIRIPQMSDEQLEQFRRSAADAARGVKS